MGVALDDQEALAAADPGNMLQTVRSAPRLWQAGRDAAEAADTSGLGSPRALVVSGMGGSGIVGNVVRTLLRPHAPFPVVVVKDYHLPAFVGPDTPVLCVSYSGNTEETLSVAQHAKDAGARLLGVASGGSLARRLARWGHPVAQVPEGYQPRAALPALIGAATGLLEATGLWHGARATVSGITRALDGTGPDVPSEENHAKQWALHVATRRPVIYGWDAMAVAAMRFKSQLNENAKIFARSERLPEGNHNDIVPWGADPDPDVDTILFLRAPWAEDVIQARVDYLARLAENHGVPIKHHHPKSMDRPDALLETIQFGDITSVYTACARGVDPTPVAPIDGLKNALLAANQ